MSDRERLSGDQPGDPPGGTPATDRDGLPDDEAPPPPPAASARVSRRAILTAGAVGAVAGAAVTAAVGSGLLNNRVSTARGGQASPGAQITPATGQPAPPPGGSNAAHQVPAGSGAAAGPSAGFTYLNPLEVNVINAAAARIIPTDENGPGAREAGVVYFIDRQLSADYGFVGRRYMQGPFALGLPTQGDQSMLIYRQRYRLGVLGMQALAQQRYKQNFAELTGDQQDAILKDMEAGNAGFFSAATLQAPPNVQPPAGAGAPPASPSPSPSPSPSASPNPAAALSTPGTSNVQATAVASSTQAQGPGAEVASGVSAQAFFQLLRSHVQAGFFADPVHGGNRDMVGWKLIGFPGVQNYADWISRYNTPFDQPYMSLADHQRTLEPGT